MPFDTEDKRKRAMTATLSVMQEATTAIPTPTIILPPQPSMSTTRNNADNIWAKLDRATATTSAPVSASPADSLPHD